MASHKYYYEHVLETVKNVVKYGREANVEKLTFTWEQYIGGNKAETIPCALTVTYRPQNGGENST